MKTILLVLVVSLCSSFVNAQSDSTTSKSSFAVTADLVSNYVWRGTASNCNFMNPHFQPTLAWTHKNITIGAWASTDFIGKYKEVDYYVTYAIGTVKVTVSDYNWLFASDYINDNNDLISKSYFNYDAKNTDHIIEATVGYSDPEKCPFSISGNVMLYGADKKWDDNLFAGYDGITGDSITGAQDITKNNYSAYVEMGYAFKYCNVFLGISPTDGYYGDSYGNKKGICFGNIGVSSTNEVKINDDYSLTYKSSLIVNPQAEAIFLVFGITF